MFICGFVCVCGRERLWVCIVCSVCLLYFCVGEVGLCVSVFYVLVVRAFRKNLRIIACNLRHCRRYKFVRKIIFKIGFLWDTRQRDQY